MQNEEIRNFLFFSRNWKLGTQCVGIPPWRQVPPARGRLFGLSVRSRVQSSMSPPLTPAAFADPWYPPEPGGSLYFGSCFSASAVSHETVPDSGPEKFTDA